MKTAEIGEEPTSRFLTKTLRLMKDLRFTSAITVEGRFVRQRGGRHHFGEVVLTIEASDTPSATYSWEVPESQIPSMFQQATFNGIQAWFREGSALDGYELRHTHIRVVGGSHHEIDSNESSYTYAATNAFALAINTAGLLAKPLVSPFES
ncbi:hypothetical protein [Variovorax sp. LT1R16]|uniref:hypothetical protein n=1 Tax=Variovorax sp. LT1R16 TaxID=3443728 RepID=UPI003F4513D7